jgi:hypothetical protein
LKHEGVSRATRSRRPGTPAGRGPSPGPRRGAWVVPDACPSSGPVVETATCVLKHLGRGGRATNGANPQAHRAGIESVSASSLRREAVAQSDGLSPNQSPAGAHEGGRTRRPRHAGPREPGIWSTCCEDSCGEQSGPDANGEMREPRIDPAGVRRVRAAHGQPRPSRSRGATSETLGG